ncbi:MAG: TolC family protein [Ferruginibacter sp.]|nr:TolC family protein [Ferruginibacter sp.]
MFGCVAGTNTFSQRVLTVEEAVAAALKNNYDIQLLRNDSAVYALNYGYRNAGFLPRLNATTSVLYNNNNTTQRLADGTERKQSGIRSSNLQSSVNLNWTVFDGLKMFATRDKLAEFVALGNLTIRNQLVTSISDVIKTYYNIVRQKQQLLAISEQMAINEERVKQADKKLTVGLGAKPELLQAKLDLNAQKAAQLKQLTLIEQLKEQLNQLLVFEQGSSYEVTDSIPINQDLLVTDIFTTAQSTNPELQVAKQNINIANITLRERRAERFPVVSLNSAYNFSKTDNKLVVNNFTPLFNQNHGFNYGLTVSIPILNNFTVRRQIKEAQLDIDYQQILYNYKQATINTAISNAYKTYELQKRTLALEEENIKLARENVFIALERNRLGLSTILELRETQKSLADAYDRLIAARYDTKVSETDLLRLRGDIIK